MAILAAAALGASPAAAQGPGGGRTGGGPGGQRQQGAGSGAGSYGATMMGDAVIEYDAQTGSLIIITDEETNSQIGQIIENLDRPAPQVLIKVLFLEVTHGNAIDLGTEGSYSFDFGSDNDSTGLAETLFGISGLTRGGFVDIETTNLEATLYALAETGKLEVLARPSVLTRNNEQATITIGQEIPFIRNSRITNEGQTINTVEYDDVGIILEVTPHITPDRLVELEVYPEISTIGADSVEISPGVSTPVIAKRSAETRVVVEDGRTVVIGGMMEDNVVEAIQKIPLLGDVPIVGYLFKRKTRVVTKTELLICLTPQVIMSREELRSMSRGEMQRLKITPQAFTEGQLDTYVEDLHRQEEMDELLPEQDMPTP